MSEALDVLLEQMKRAAENACVFIEGMERADFLADVKTQQAVVMSLIIIGEAATRIVNRHADYARHRLDIPWNNMRGMRNRIAHGYFEINFDVVWAAVKSDLPTLIQSLSTKL